MPYQGLLTQDPDIAGINYKLNKKNIINENSFIISLF